MELEQFEFWLELQIYFASKTYRIRVHNVGISTTLNFRIQNHNLLLVETEGYYTDQANYTNFDIHAGQSYSFLLSTDQNASTHYYIVVSARFVNESLWQKVTGVAVLQTTLLYFENTLIFYCTRKKEEMKERRKKLTV